MCATTWKAPFVNNLHFLMFGDFMSVKKSPLQKEEDNILGRKKSADYQWDSLIERIRNGEKIDHQVLAYAMDECNMADYGLIQRNLSKHLESLKHKVILPI